MPRGRPKGSKSKPGHKKLGRPRKTKIEKRCEYIDNYKRCNNNVKNNNCFCDLHKTKKNEEVFVNNFDLSNNEVIIDEDKYEDWKIESNYKYYLINNKLWKYYDEFDIW